MRGDADGIGGRVVLVDVLAPAARAPQAPPGTCERCGCRLSHYRADGETLCWPCSAATANDGPSARTRRVLAFVLEGRRQPAPHTLKGGQCPACGGRKDPKARLCRDCWKIDQRLLFARNPAKTCPRCGRPKVRKARHCRQCSDFLRYGTRYLDGRPVGMTCPECGGPKRLKRARRCRTCSLRHRSSRRRLAALTA